MVDEPRRGRGRVAARFVHSGPPSVGKFLGCSQATFALPVANTVVVPRRSHVIRPDVRHSRLPGGRLCKLTLLMQCLEISSE